MKSWTNISYELNSMAPNAHTIPDQNILTESITESTITDLIVIIYYCCALRIKLELKVSLFATRLRKTLRVMLNFV